VPSIEVSADFSALSTDRWWHHLTWMYARAYVQWKPLSGGFQVAGSWSLFD
jgi:hypothetical protein